MLVGYGRASTAEQSLALQQDALTAAGCGRVYTDVASGAVDDRDGLADALDYVRDGDTLVVWRLDRLGRSLTEAMDTTTSGGRLIFHVFGALAEFERAVIRERTLAGLAAARARGRLGGRPRALSPAQVEMARTLLADRTRPIADVCGALHVSRATLSRYVTTRPARGADASGPPYETRGLGRSGRPARPCARTPVLNT